MKLAAPKIIHFAEMMQWFSSESELRAWAGPSFRYPFDTQTFAEDLKLESLHSFSLIADDSRLLAFGQFYNRLNRCHLGRLVVSPSHRGKGLIQYLLQLLSERGLKELRLNSNSLFVLENNLGAISAYKKFGFIQTTYPEPMPIDDCLYMIRKC